MLRKIFLAGAALLLVPVLLSAYTVVLKNGRRLEAQSRYVVEGNLVKFMGMDGRPYQFPLAEVDVAATERANPTATPEAARRPRPKVWTNDELERLEPRAGVSVTSTAAAPPAAAPPEGEAAEEVAEEAAEDEPKPLPPKADTPEYWQERVKALRDELANIEQQIQRLRQGQGRAASNALSLVTDAPGVDVQDTIRRLEQRRTQVQQEIEAVQLEAKRKGIPPGVVR